MHGGHEVSIAHGGATVVGVPGGHAIYVSQPKAVAKLIEQAAAGKK